MEGIAKYFPPELREDPDRLDVLYAPFRDKSVNPKGYESKLKTWQDAIAQYMRVHKIVSIEAEELTRAFACNEKRPRCLNEVFAESIRSEDLVSELEYCNSLRSDERGWVPWAVGLGFDYLVKKPVSMTFNWAWTSIAGGASNVVKGNFVSREMVVELSEKLQRLFDDPAFREKLARNRDGLGGALASEDATVEFEVVLRETTSVVNDEKTLSILLAHLQSKGAVRMSKLILGGEEKTFVFFDGVHRKTAAASSTSLFAATPVKNEAKKELTEKEKTLLQLEATAKELVRQIEAIHSEMTELQEKAKGYLAKGIKPLALNALKRKKMLRGKVESREKSLENIDGMISKLQDVDSNKMVYSAYKEAVAALNKSLTEADLDSIDETMDDMRDVLDRQAEMEEALSGRNLRPDDVDDEEEELELELEQILDENDDDDPKTKVVLPEVPLDDIDNLLDNLCISPVKVETTEKRHPQPQLAL